MKEFQRGRKGNQVDLKSGVLQDLTRQPVMTKTSIEVSKNERNDVLEALSPAISNFLGQLSQKVQNSLKVCHLLWDIIILRSLPSLCNPESIRTLEVLAFMERIYIIYILKCRLHRNKWRENDEFWKF